MNIQAAVQLPFSFFFGKHHSDNQVELQTLSPGKCALLRPATGMFGSPEPVPEFLLQ